MNFSVVRRVCRACFVEEFGAFDQFVPGGGRLHVDLDHARVRGDAEVAQARIAGGS
jgi:hypothetical protein